VTDTTAALSPRWSARLLSRNAAVLLGRNTVVSTLVFLLGLFLLWVLVEFAHADMLWATAFTFLLANTLHYALGRAWIYRGTTRAIVPGYGFFLVNAVIGLAVTVVLFDLAIRFAGIHYLAARVLVSVAAGLVMFLLNATVNFGRL
jgi:putative flippase GtrA